MRPGELLAREPLRQERRHDHFEWKRATSFEYLEDKIDEGETKDAVRRHAYRLLALEARVVRPEAA